MAMACSLIGLVNALRKGGLRRSGSGRFVGEFLRVLVRAWRGQVKPWEQDRRAPWAGLNRRRAGRRPKSRRWRPWRQLRLDQGKKLSERVRVARLDERGIGFNPVDDRKPGFDAGAMTRVDAAAELRGENKG